MPEYEVEVIRTAYSTRDIVVEAKDEEEAKELACEAAGDYVFKESTADYDTGSVVLLPPKPPPKPEIRVDMSGVDWNILREQKSVLLSERELAGGSGTPTAKAALSGIVHLLDHVQDSAARVIGAKSVFGRDDNDG
jgi:hypothetical protein